MERQQTPLVALVDVSAKMGGVEFSTLYLAQRMDRNRFRPLVICPEEGDLPSRCRESGIPVQIVRQPHLLSSSVRIGRRTVVNPLSWLVNGVLFIVIAWRLRRVLRQHDVALVCTKGMFAHFYGGLAAKMAFLPCVWHVQDLVSKRLYAWVFGRAGQILATHLIANGAQVEAFWLDYLPQSQISVVYNGVDTDFFSPQVDGSAVRIGWQADSETLLIGNAARLTPWKGQDHLIRAFARIANEFSKARLVLVGTPLFDDVAFERLLHQLVIENQLQDRVIFAGFRWDLPQVLAALDIYVQPSVWKDGNSMSVISAAASGKAMICTEVVELLENGVDTILVPIADDKALADALHRMISDFAYREALGVAARRTAEQKMSLDQFARACEAVFEKTLSL